METNEATRTLDDTHLLLPSLQTHSPVKTPSPNPGTEAGVSMASKVTERNFAGRKEVFVPPPPPTNAYPLDHETHILLPSLKTRPPVKTPSPNSGTKVGVSMASTVNERNFVGRKEVVFVPPPLDSTNAYHIHETHLLLPSLQTRPPINTPTPNPGTEASVSMESTVTERNFVGRKEIVFSPPPSPSTNPYPLEETHLLLPSLQTHSPVKTPSPNPGTEASVSMASRVTERNFAGRKKVAFAPPSTNIYPLYETHLLLPSLQTRPPVKTPTPNPGTEAGV
ncbi:hypothetical protein HAX54_032786 [Datura stramonium]|uniref:Uncharacterized protein n=1 Tax=Datura stramonium TaxID=4076 RepID=A0ABS8Y8M7_DATST|nr:hypothetical protein [Datura stramonium]